MKKQDMHGRDRGRLRTLRDFDDVYEPPLSPEIVCDTDRELIEESVAKVFNYLVENFVVL
jgi:adenylylsulfate kinase